MGRVETVTEQMKAAMKAKDSARLTALRSIRAAFLVEMKKDGAETLEEDVAIAALRRLAKQHQESIEAYEKAGRAAQLTAEKSELAVVEEFLPSLADEATTRAWVEEAIATTGASTAKELGRVMGTVMKAHKGDVDGDLARRLASERLGG
jgi:uncharacterized protein YqeY